MESGYLLDSALNFLNFEMIGAGIALIIIYYAIRDYIRVTTFTVGYLFILLCAPLWQPFVAQLRAPAPATEVVASVDNAKKPAEEEKKSDLIPQTAEPTSKNLDEWLKRFHDTEKDRRAGQAGERFNAVRYSSAEYLLTFQRRLEGRGSGKSRSSQAVQYPLREL